jgi:hypothetical protein
MCVITDGVWIGDWIYLPFIHMTRKSNYSFTAISTIEKSL